jgi:glutamate N-acetyltransferase/amino-acid N-acetyltransferase
MPEHGAFASMSSKPSPVSPLAPASSPDLPPIAGVRLATAQAGIRYSGRTDVLFVGLEPGTQAAGVFTRSKCPSAPVDWCREALSGGTARALVVNSGNANAFTGRLGREAVALTAKIAAQAAGCGEREIFIASTGVIGEPLPAERFEGVLADCAGRAMEGSAAWTEAARRS